MKITIKVTLIVAMFCMPVLADDGNQGAGGRHCNPQVEQCGDGLIGGGSDEIPGSKGIKNVVEDVFEAAALYLGF